MMNRTGLTLIIFALFAGCFFTSCNEAETQENNTDNVAEASGSSTEDSPNSNEQKPELTNIKWDTIFHDFGKVKEGPKYRQKFFFTNTGNVPLIIKKAYGSCGCTTADNTKDPVPPGGQGFVEAIFDSKGRSGVTKGKYVTVICNTNPKAHKLSFEAEVID